MACAGMIAAAKRLTDTGSVLETGSGNGGTALSEQSTQQQHFLDHLDIWSIWALLRQGTSGDRIFYLTRSRGWPASALIGFLERRGWHIAPVCSPYENRKDGFDYPDLSRKILEAGTVHLQPVIEKTLVDAGIEPNWEMKRLARYLVLGHFKQLKRSVELTEAARREARTGTNTVIHIQYCRITAAAFPDVDRHNTSLRPYRACFRFRMAARPGYFDHETDRWSGEALLATIMRLPAILILSLFAVLCGLRPNRGSEGQGPGKLDILALSGRRDPDAQLDDLYWLDSLRRLADVQTGLFHTTTAPAACREYYQGRIQFLWSLKGFLSNRTGIGGEWTRVRRRHARAAFGAIFRLGRNIFFRQMPFDWAVRIAGLEERTGLFEAVIDATGARLVWTMQEGHEMNTQALALAAHRRGAVSLGTSWSLKHNPCLASANNRNDVMFVWGSRHQDIFVRSGALVQHYVMTGYPTSAAARQLAESARSASGAASRKICFYDNLAGSDTAAAPHDMIRTYETVLTVAAANPGWTLIIKGKRDEYRRLGPDLTEKIEAAIRDGWLEFRDQPGDLSSGLESDIVIGVAAATLTLIAAQHGVSAIVYDPSQIFSDSPAGKLPDLTVCRDARQLSAALQEAMDRTCAIAAAPGDIDAFADNLPADRTAAYMTTLLSQLHGGMAVVEAVRAANETFQSRWGKDKVTTLMH